MMRILRSSIFLLTLLAAPLAKATHLIGGNLGYTYLGETSPGSGIYRYQVYMQFYMNCGPDSNWPDFATLLQQSGGTLPVGIYIQDPLNPNADKQPQVMLDLELLDSLQIVPDLPDNCTVGDGLCTLLGTFGAEVELPLNFGGYHLYYQMCCRNLSILNLDDPNNTGIGYYAYIPPPLVNNSSPIWLGIPTPFLCINDTSTFINSATDPDGDQLIFSFETPYNSTNQGGGIQPPPPVLPWPLPQVQYAPGFSLPQPFGAGGYSFINGATGLTAYLPPLQGNYVVAVEVKEFRNGQLIGRTRRDLQLQAIVCPANETPQVSGALNTSYSVNEGEQLCFNMNFLDVDADSITLTASGTIFDSLFYNPPAVIDTPAVGNGAVSAEFCWDTDCEQGQDQPYLFSVSVQDNGCPPKQIDVVFQINVIPFAGPQTIDGPLQVCEGQEGSVYTTPSISGATFNWTVNGGTVASGQGTASISVDWGIPGTGTVSVSATNAQGCLSEEVNVDVNIVNLPVADAGRDTIICWGETILLGGNPTGPPGSSYTWTPADSLDDGTLANPLLTTNDPGTYVVQVTNSGCANYDTIMVIISKPHTYAGEDTTICFGDTIQLTGFGTGTVTWDAEPTLSDPNSVEPFAWPGITTTYFLTNVDSLGCTRRDSVTITVNQLPLVDAGLDASICPGDTAVLGGAPTGPDGSTYSWSPSAELNDASLANPSAIPMSTTTYTVLVTDSNTCANSDQVTITTLPIPNVDAGPDHTICAGDSVQLDGTATGQLLWTPSNGLNDPTIEDPWALPEGTTTYTLTVIGQNNCANSDQTTVTVNLLPSANAGPDQTICIGDTIEIGTPGPGTFTWSPGATLSATDIATPLAFPTVNTTYTVQLSDTNACAQIDSMMVIVNLPPNAGTDGAATSCSDGIAIDLTTLIGGSPDAGGTWSPDSIYDPGSGSQVFIYVVNGLPGCSNDTAFVSITEITAANAGGDQVLSICSSDDPVDLFTLFPNGTDTTGTWTGPGGSPSDGTYTPGSSTPGEYVYAVTVPAPCVNDTARVVVTENASAQAGVDDAVSICGSGISFTMIDSLGGTPDAGGQWLAPDLTPHGDVFDPAIDLSGTYTYVAGFSTTCPDSASLAITITNPQIQFSGDAVICTGDTTQITASGGTTYSWSPNTDISDPNIADPFFYPTSTTTYTVTVTDANNCTASADQEVTVNQLPGVNAGNDQAICEGASATIGGNPTSPTATSFAWTPPGSLDDATDPNPVATPSSTTTYTVVVSDGNQCSNTDSVVIAVNPTPSLDAGADTSVCLGSGVQLNAIGAGTFSWDPTTGLSDPNIANPIASPTSTITYTVTLQDGNNCTATDDITVTVAGLPSANAGPDVWVCPGFDVQLQGSGGGTFLWTPNLNIDDNTLANPLVSPSSSIVYTLTITDGNGCTATDNVVVTVNSDPPVSPGSDQSICDGQEAQLGGSPTSIPGATYLWTPAAGLDDPTSANPIASPSQTTLYTVTVTSDTCTSQGQALVTLAGVADAEFSMELEPNCEVVHAFITDQSSGAAQWFWDFGDGTTSTEQSPQHEFPYGQNIVVVLTVTDAFGCIGTDTVNIAVSSFAEYVHYVVPNVFTPNGDGKNDVFTINTNAVLGECVNMMVFSRWGQKVFESLGNDLVWTGRNFAGEECVTGTYFYTIEFKEMTFKGTVMLNR